MVRKMSFFEAVRKGIIKEGDKVNPIECFWCGKNEVILTEEETGYESNVFKREDNLEWRFFWDYQRIPCLFASTTEFNFNLNAECGYANYITILNKIVATYSSNEWGCIARSMRKEDYYYFRNNREFEMGYDGIPYYVASTSVYKRYNSLMLGVYWIHSKGEIEKRPLFDSSGIGYATRARVRPVISILKSKLCVDLDSMERSGAWRIFWPRWCD